MALQTKQTTVQAVSGSPYQLDPAQTLRAANALLKKMQSDFASRSNSSGKQDLLEDSEEEQEEPIWLCVTTKKHIIDKKRLKPGRIALPHSLTSLQPATADTPGTKICLITADPQRQYKDLIEHPNFPAATRGLIAKVIGLEKVKARYKSFEARRQLVSEYDIFLADDRTVTQLPKLLGKVFYHGGAKRPIPINLQGKKDRNDEKGEKRKPLVQGGTKAIRDAPNPESVAREIERALSSALVHLSPGTNTSVKVGTTRMSAEQVQANIDAVVAGMVAKYVPQGWRGVKGLHVKGPRTASLPIWLADELWETEDDVLDQEVEVKSVLGKRVAEIEGGKSGKKRKSTGGAVEEEVAEKEAQKARRAEMKKLKEKSRAEVKASA
ncbi:ribosomal protein L1 [Myriangium duriaei CBS 260.36]|uniref:Ribosomal protein L1 n=1 Tax=Myriangium duriaei CBS 260.36 TaxID=1168546 RepID=A0A9P4MIL3_9PEZI|nr:ribosomal protein L1 [Myriangium duriaei CBS 260.36]